MAEYWNGIEIVTANRVTFNGMLEGFKTGSLFIPTLDTPDWPSVVDGTASVVLSNSIVSARTAATNDSTAVGYNNPGYLTRGLANSTRVNWDKDLFVQFDCQLNAAGTGGESRFLIYEQNSPAVGDHATLSAKGIGLFVDNLVLKGETYDTQSEVVALSESLTAAQGTRITIIHTAGVGVEWFVNSVSKGTSTREPTGQAGAFTRIGVMCDNASTAANKNFEVTNLMIWQES